MPIALGKEIENDYAKLFFQPPLSMYGNGIGHMVILKLKQPACWVDIEKHLY